MVNRPYWFSFIALISGVRTRHELNVEHAEYDHFPNLGGTVALVRCCARYTEPGSSRLCVNAIAGHS
jgi:hypothetical protein